MRGLKTTVGLFVVLIGLGAYIYFVESRREPEDPNARPKAFEITAEDIEELQFRNAEGQASRVQRSGEGWQIVEPEPAEADSGVVGTVTSNLASLEVQRVVDENPSDLAQYGLNPARIEVAFRPRDAKEPVRLLIGDKTPTGGDLFAKRPDEQRVFLIASFLDAIFNKTPFELRDKTILEFERDKADGVEVVRGANTLRLTRSGTDWRIAAPIAARADYAAAEGILTRLSSTNMLRVVASEAADLSPYGLDRPALTATVTSGSSRATLLVGRTAEEGGVFAKDASRPVVFAVEQALVTDLEKDTVDLRRRDLFDARSYSANRVEIRRGDQTVTLEKTEADGTSTWRNAAGQTVQTSTVEDAVARLSALRAESFTPTADRSLQEPVLTVTIRFDENRAETVSFGRGADRTVFAARGDEPGAARVETTAFDEAMKAVDALK